MHSLRRLVRSNRLIAATFLVLALLVKLVVPVGFMPVVDNGRIVISICSGSGPMALSIPDLGHGPSDGHGDLGRSEQPCVFAGLSTASLAAADPVVLAAAILFILALGLLPARTLVATAPAYLRPPTRGPPVCA